MTKIYRWITLGLLAYTSLAFEPRAEACSPPADGIYDSIPHNGEVYPANAALLFYGYEISLDRVTVTVDGVPAAFADPGPKIKEVATIAALITPEPMAGQTVVVQGSFCAPDVPPKYECAPFSRTYKAGPRDEGALSGVHIASFDIHDYVHHPLGAGDCRDASDFAFWMHLTPTSQPGASLQFYTIEGYHTKEQGSLAVEQSGTLPSDGKVDIHASEGDIVGASLPEALCFRATMFDLAGHVAPWSELVCDPCHYHVDPPSPGAISNLWEPEWTESDIYPGGSCDRGGTGSSSSSGGGGTGGGGTGGGNDEDEKEFGGCACQSVGGGGSPPAQLSLLAFCAALAVSSRRRRRS